MISNQGVGSPAAWGRSNAEQWILWEKEHCSEWGSQGGGLASEAGSGGVLEPGNDGEMEQGMMVQQVCKEYL